MPFVLNRVERGRYLDSVALMRLSRRLSALPGIEEASLMIGSPSNKALLRDAGLLAPEGEDAGANDLVIALRATDERLGQAALRSALEVQREHISSETLPRVGSLATALDVLPQANLALISLPGEFAMAEARKALNAGLHALVFSSGVPLAEERALKLLARGKGLLLMGPDCGTALIAGTPLAFANAVPRGDIGIVSASGTGLQEVSCLLARMGRGVSHGIGVGGRDLDERVGALATLAAIDALEQDPRTATIVLLSSRPHPLSRTRCSSVSRAAARKAWCAFSDWTSRGSHRPCSRRRKWRQGPGSKMRIFLERRKSKAVFTASTAAARCAPRPSSSSSAAACKAIASPIWATTGTRAAARTR